MNRELDFNLFKYAHKELSHTAFWAWVLDCTRSEDEALNDVIQLGRSFLEKAAVSADITPIEIKTEYTLPNDAGRADLWMLMSDRSEIVIETKVKASLVKEQLDRYRSAMERGNFKTRFVILSISFVDDVVHEIESEGEWVFFSEEDLLDIIFSNKGNHPLISDYREWLYNRIAERQENRKNVYSLNKTKVEDSLRTVEGQWQLMRDLFQASEESGHQYRGSNPDGKSWTQYRFVSDENDEDDAIFYRLDFYNAGPYLSVRQYQNPIFPNFRAKRERLTELRAVWNGVCDSFCKELNFGSPHNRGKNESEIGVLMLNEPLNYPHRLKRIFPAIHDRFTSELARRGFAIS